MSLYTESIAVDPGSWTPAVAPFDCDTVLVVNNSAAPLAVRGAAGQGEIELLAGTEREFGGSRTRSELGQRYRTGATALELQPESGTGPIHLVWS